MTSSPKSSKMLQWRCKDNKKFSNVLHRDNDSSPENIGMKEAYSLICKARDIFKRKITREEARAKLHEWYKEISTCTFREIKSARDCIKSREEEVLNYFLKRSTNASAESLNSKMKGFRAQLHGIADIPFFLYRVSAIFG